MNYDKDQLLKNLNEIESLLVQNKIADAFCLFQKEAKMEGVGPAFFTKILYFLGQGNSKINPKPLIFDKWTKNAYFALLLENSEFSKAKKFYKGINYNFSNTPGALEINESKHAECYNSYVLDFHDWAKEIGSNASRLEEFVFGESMRKNKCGSNPRIQLWEIIRSNLDQIIKMDVDSPQELAKEKG